MFDFSESCVENWIFVLNCLFFSKKKEEDGLACFTLEGMSEMEISASLNFGDPCFGMCRGY